MYPASQHQVHQAAATGGMAERIRWFFIGIIELIASNFSLLVELPLRRNPGRRYYTLLGVFVAYYTTAFTYYIVAFFSPYVSHEGGLKPTFTLDPLDLQQPEADLLAEPASPLYFLLLLKLLVAVALLHKVLMFVRKVRGTEPPLTVWGGQSHLSLFVGQPPRPLVRHLAFGEDGFCKRYVEPLFVYVLGAYVCERFFDPIVASYLTWSAIAMAVRAYCIRLRYQRELDDIGDIQVKTQHVFASLDDTRDRLRPARASLHREPTNNGVHHG